MFSAPQSRTISLTHVLGLEDSVRVQDPDIFVTEGKHPQWFIRPFIDTFDREGNPTKRQTRIYLGRCDEIKKREAITKKNEIMARINKSQVILQAQLKFGALLDYYLENHVRRPRELSASTQQKYEIHIKNHIRPMWGEKMLAEIRTLEGTQWMAQLAKPRVIDNKVKPGMAWSTRVDLRNLMHGIFEKAEQWGLWKNKNPFEHVSAGRREDARPRRKLTTEETRRLLDALPTDVRQLCETALYCALRISEVLGIQWKHVDFVNRRLVVAQRLYRGDLDVTKTRKSKREVPMGDLAQELAERYPGPAGADGFVFSVQTHVGRWSKPGATRDDRDINQHFLRPAAKSLGLYYKGFGFHAFRVEANTEYQKALGPMQTQRMMGHATAAMGQHYTQADWEAQEQAVRELQARVRGAVIPIRKEA